METATLVAPVTALEFLQDTFLLTGEQRCLDKKKIETRKG